jgi:hypothetical protein
MIAKPFVHAHATHFAFSTILFTSPWSIIIKNGKKTNIDNKIETNLSGSESNEDLILDLFFDQMQPKIEEEELALSEVVPQLITKF